MTKTLENLQNLHNIRNVLGSNLLAEEIDVFFDCDDTFIITNPEYEKTNENTAKMIISKFAEYGFGLSMTDVLKKHRALDVEYVKIHGFVTSRYPMSWVDTYLNYAEQFNVTPDEKFKKEVEDHVNDIYIRKFEPYPYLHETLEEVRNLGVNVHALTAGDEKVQRKRLKDADIEHFFKEVHIVPFKNPKVYLDVLQSRCPSKCIMVGNSLKSDIYPAIDNGSYAIHIQRDTWEVDHYNLDTTNKLYVPVQELHHVPDALSKILSVK